MPQPKEIESYVHHHIYPVLEEFGATVVETHFETLMIYSRFGTALTLVSKTEDDTGKMSVQATTGGTADLHEYHVTDLKADDDSTETLGPRSFTKANAAVSKLPMKVFENKSGRRRKPF